MELIVVVAVLALVAGLIALLWWMDQKRTEGWKAQAAALGYTFRGDVPMSQLPGATRFQIFQKGASPSVHNLIVGQEGPAVVAICDFEFTTGSGKHRTVVRQTLCLIDSPEVEPIACFMRPELPLYDFFGKLLGGQDIQFDDDPAFSKAYVLQGPDEEAVRRVFSPALRAFFSGKRAKNWLFEIQGRILCLNANKRVSPSKASELIADGLEILSAMRARAPKGA